MNYQLVYDQIINKARSRGLDKSILDGYYEYHHIVPTCMDGLDINENMVLLTAKEHFIAHVLLCKIHTDNYSLYYAFIRMRSCNINGLKYNSNMYKRLKERYSEMLSKSNSLRVWKDSSKKLISEKNKVNMMGNTHMLGFKHSPESKKLMSIRHSGANNHRYGKSVSQEVRDKISNSHKGKKLSKEHRDSLSKAMSGTNNPMYGKKHTEESKTMMSINSRRSS